MNKLADAYRDASIALNNAAINEPEPAWRQARAECERLERRRTELLWPGMVSLGLIR